MRFFSVKEYVCMLVAPLRDVADAGAPPREGNSEIRGQPARDGSPGITAKLGTVGGKIRIPATQQRRKAASPEGEAASAWPGWKTERNCCLLDLDGRAGSFQLL